MTSILAFVILFLLLGGAVALLERNHRRVGRSFHQSPLGADLDEPWRWSH